MIRLRSLGECVIEIGETRIGPQQEMLFAVLLRLLLASSHRCRRPDLLDLIWPNHSERRARHSLRQVLYTLRCKGANVVADGDEVAIADDVHLDCVTLDKSIPTARPDTVLTLALSIQGPFLRGYSPRFSDPYSNWLEHAREQVHTSAVGVLEAALHLLRKNADWQRIAQLSQLCRELDPLNEPATLALAESAALSGHRPRALAVLESYTKELADLEARPSRRVRALHERLTSIERHPLPTQSATLPPLYGRSDEMRWIQRQLQQGAEGQGRAILLVGEEGIGKSRVCAETLACAHLLGMWSCSLALSSADPARPFAVLSDLLPSLLNAPGAIGADPESLLALRRLHSQPATSELRHPEAIHAQLIGAFTELIDAVSSEQPILIVVDDAQWLDKHSTSVIRHLHARPSERAVITLLSCRISTTTTDDIGIEPGSRFALGPLSPEATSNVIEYFSSTLQRALPPSTIDRFVRLSGGNPLYASELARSDDPSGDAEIPQSLRGLIARRLARLSKPAHEALQVVALLDGNATIPRVTTLLNRSLQDLTYLFTELEIEGLIRWEAGVVRQHNAIIGTIALSTLSPLLLATYHLRIAENLESSASNQDTPRAAWAAAEHWRLAGEFGRASALLARCARQSLHLGSPEQATEHLELALRLTTGTQERSELLPLLVQSLTAGGRWARAAEVAGELVSQGHTSLELLTHEIAWRSGAPLSRLLDRIRSCVMEAGVNSTHRVRAAGLGMICADNMLDLKAGREIFSAVAQDLEAPDLSAFEKAYCSMVYAASFGDMSTAAPAAWAVYNAALSLDDPFRSVLAIRHAAIALRIAGLVDDSLGLLQEAYERAILKGLGTAARSVALTLEGTYLALGDFARSDHWASATENSSLADEDSVATTQHLAFQARLALLRRQYAAAELLLDQAKAVLRDNGSLRAKMFSYALGIRIKQESRHCAIDENELGQLVRWHLHARDMGGHDVVMEALYAALRDHSPHEAHHYFEQYVSRFRRERDPISYSLALLVGERRTLAMVDH